MTDEERAAVKVAVLAMHGWDGDTDSDGQPCDFHNFYMCEECDVEWDDYWSCSPDGECGQCGFDISPYRSDIYNFATGSWERGL